jgi:hypothetical protein
MSALPDAEFLQLLKKDVDYFSMPSNVSKIFFLKYVRRCRISGDCRLKPAETLPSNLKFFYRKLSGAPSWQ